MCVFELIKGEKPQVIISLLVIMYSCSGDESGKLHHFKGPAMGSTYSVTYTGKQVQGLKKEVEDFLKAFNRSLSTYDPNSMVSALNSNKTDKPDSLNLYLVLKSLNLSERTHGAFDITVAPLVDAWGFGLKNAGMMDRIRVDSLLAFVGYKKIRLENGVLIKEDPRTQLNYNAVAPGYAADLLSNIMEKYNCADYMINVGGEIRCKGVNGEGKAWKIGVEKPLDNKTGQNPARAVISLDNQALATSGNYRQFYYSNGKRYNHTIDPRSGYPVQHNLLSATVVAGNALNADALATACMVLGLEGAKELVKTNPDIVGLYLIYLNEDGTMGEFISTSLKDKVKVVE